MDKQNPFSPANTATQKARASSSRWQLPLLGFALLLLGMGIYLYSTQEQVTIYTPYSDWHVSFSEAGPSVRVAILRVVVTNACLLLVFFLLTTSAAMILLRKP